MSRDPLSARPTTVDLAPVASARRPKAPHKILARATRRILIDHGAPLRASEVFWLLEPELRATVGHPSKLPRILRRSQRAGLIQTPSGWWVRKPWLAKPDKARGRNQRKSGLALTRQALDVACSKALEIIKTANRAMSVDELLHRLADPALDRRKFKRAMWNRAKADRAMIRFDRPASYRWAGRDATNSAS
jgi:hypothetical protein